MQVLIKPSLVDRLCWPEAKGDGREFPEVGELARVGVRGESVRSGNLLAESVHLFFRETPFNESARVRSGRGVTLEEDVVAAARVILTAEEVVEAYLVKR